MTMEFSPQQRSQPNSPIRVMIVAVAITAPAPSRPRPSETNGMSPKPANTSAPLMKAHSISPTQAAFDALKSVGASLKVHAKLAREKRFLIAECDRLLADLHAKFRARDERQHTVEMEKEELAAFEAQEAAEKEKRFAEFRKQRRSPGETGVA